MANRVTGVEVKEIFDTDMTAEDLAPFITAANLTVTDMLGTNTELSDEQRKEIERWLTAHFACSYDPRMTAVKVDVISISYEKAFSADKTALKSTSYGRMVAVLDTTGILNRGRKRPAIVETLDFIDGGT